ncbi:MAG: insulinase family protein [Verrucomicrobia bacterium]|nr:insulinase family protein [Verrucomicrobiota bacterium]
MHRVVNLPNGVRLALAPMPDMASVSLGFWVGVGGRYEPAPVNGVSHFIEHMLFKGTRRRTAREISQAVEGVGGYLNAWTSEEHTCFYAKARHDRFAELLDVLADMLLHSRFAPRELEKERGVIQEEVAMYLDQPAQHVQELLNALQWPDHPLGRPLTGTEESVARLRRPDLLSFFRHHYHGQNLVIAVAGCLNPDEVIPKVGRFAGSLPGNGGRSVFDPIVIRQDRPRLRVQTRKTEQAQLALGLRTCSRHDDRRFALRLLNTVLGENMSSRLFQIVREETGLAYNIYSSLSFFDDVGDLVISAGLDPDALPKVLRLVVRELRRLKTTAPSATELRRARDYVIGQMDLSLENTENRMMWLGEQVLGYGKVTPVEAVKDKLQAVRPADLRRVASDFFLPNRANLALVAPLRRSPRLVEILETL